MKVSAGQCVERGGNEQCIYVDACAQERAVGAADDGSVPPSSFDDVSEPGLAAGRTPPTSSLMRSHDLSRPAFPARRGTSVKRQAERALRVRSVSRTPWNASSTSATATPPPTRSRSPICPATSACGPMRSTRARCCRSADDEHYARPRRVLGRARPWQRGRQREATRRLRPRLRRGRAAPRNSSCGSSTICSISSR